jgi:ribosomal protein S18 acetylase RimI-like enzyme
MDPEVERLVAEHPVTPFPASFARWLVETVARPGALHRLEGPPGEGPLAALLVVDAWDSATGAADLILLGARRPLARAEAHALVQAGERCAAAGPRGSVEITLYGATLDGAHLEELGYREGFRAHTMLRDAPPPAELPPAPEGLRFVPLEPEAAAPYREAVAAAFAGIPAMRMLPIEALREQIRMEAQKPHVRRELLLDADGAIAGFLTVDADEVRVLGRHPRWRGRGLGPLLLARALAHVAARGHRTAHLEVVASNAEALALYERVGFRRVRSVAILRKALR